MNAKDLLEEIRAEYAEHLRAMPWERENSLGIVHRELQERHCEAMLYVAKKYGTEISTYNLHFIIQHWAKAEEHARLVNAKPNSTLLITWLEQSTDPLALDATTIEPAHLVEYHRRKLKGYKV